MNNRFPEGYRCPLCGWPYYDFVSVAKPGGGWRRTMLLNCLGCTTVFLDPVKFVRQRKNRREAEFESRAEQLKRMRGLTPNKVNAD